MEADITSEIFLTVKILGNITAQKTVNLPSSTKPFCQQMYFLLKHKVSHAAQHPMHTPQTETYIATAQQQF